MVEYSNTEDFLIEILNDMISKGELRFGWNEDITEYKLKNWNLVKIGYICECEYGESGTAFAKEIYIKTVHLSLDRIRNYKIDNLGIK